MEGMRISVQEGIQETKRIPAPRDKLIIEDGDNTREDRARTAGTVHTSQCTIDDNSNVITDGRDIRKGTAGWVELSTIRGADRGEVGVDSFCLI